MITCALLLALSAAVKLTKFRTGLIVMNSAVCLVYIVWRATAIPLHDGPVSLILGVTLYMAELLGLMAFFNFQYLFVGRYRREKKTLADFKDGEIPFADVLICTYNEPLSLLEMTIAAAVNMDYPQDRFLVHICDDKRRDELKAPCQSYGIRYITRPDNKGAKAGNINNAMKNIHGNLMAVLDADMIPSRDFLQKRSGISATRIWRLAATLLR